jgi:hypothetical protein
VITSARSQWTNSGSRRSGLARSWFSSAASVCGSQPGRSLLARIGRLYASLQMIAFVREVGRAREPDRTAGPEAEERWLALTNVNPLSRIASMCARAGEDLAPAFRVSLLRMAPPAVADASCAAARRGPRARLRHAARGRSAPEVLLRISGRRAGCPSGRPCARSSLPPCRRIGSGCRTRCGLRRGRLEPARSS